MLSKKPAGMPRAPSVTSQPVGKILRRLRRLVAALCAVAALAPSVAGAQAWWIESGLVTPRGSLRAHRPGLTGALRLHLHDHGVSPTFTVDYVALFSHSGRVPSYQSASFYAGASWPYQIGKVRTFLRAEAGPVVSIDSFNFFFLGQRIVDDDVGLTLGLKGTAGVQFGRLNVSTAGHYNLPHADDSRLLEIRLGYLARR